MNVEDCLEKGLIKKNIQSKEKALKSIETAKRKILVSEKILKAGIFEESVVNIYSAMFHAGRALLFKDGFVEKSHFGLYVYIKEKYRDKIEPKFINELNSLRLERHELLYGLEEPEVEKEEVIEMLKIAKEFIKIVEKLL